MADDELDVWLAGRHAGQLLRRRDSRVEFTYAPEYRFARDATPLSFSMPLAKPTHAPDIVMPWLANLLPDNDRVRARWAQHFGTTDTSAFELLRHMGSDCAGAVQVTPTDADPSSLDTQLPQSERDIADRISQLRADDAAWNPSGDEFFGRFSLGGAQGKFALARTDEGWALPSGRTASTHIFKVGVHALPDNDLAEFVTTRAASKLDLPVVDMQLDRFGDQTALVVARYDRLPDTGGGVRRIHQEDLCQALGVWPEARYEKDDSGPTMADLATTIDRATSGVDRSESRALFARAVTFNLLSIGTDAHAKNHSLLHLGSRSRLTPLYDLGSAAFLFDADKVLDRAKMSVRYGTTFWVREIDGPELLRVADTLGIDRADYLESVRELASRIADAFADAVRELPSSVANPRFAAAPATIGALSTRITASIAATRASEVSRFAPRRRLTS